MSLSRGLYSWSHSEPTRPRAISFNSCRLKVFTVLFLFVFSFRDMPHQGNVLLRLRRQNVCKECSFGVKWRHIKVKVRHGLFLRMWSLEDHPKSWFLRKLKVQPRWTIPPPKYTSFEQYFCNTWMKVRRIWVNPLKNGSHESGDKHLESVWDIYFSSEWVKASGWVRYTESLPLCLGI